MENRQLGKSGLKVPVLSFGCATFGGTNEFFKKWGDTDIKEATRMVDICLDAGVNFFDTADVYSQGASEEILGKSIKGKRERILISTKATFSMGDGPNDKGSSRYHIVKACEASLRRLGTDHIDLYFMHGFDALTPVEETLRALDDLTSSGKIRYIGCSNFSGWHVMKSLAALKPLMRVGALAMVGQGVALLVLTYGSTRMSTSSEKRTHPCSMRKGPSPFAHGAGSDAAPDAES